MISTKPTLLNLALAFMGISPERKEIARRSGTQDLGGGTRDPHTGIISYGPTPLNSDALACENPMTYFNYLLLRRRLNSRKRF